MKKFLLMTFVSLGLMAAVSCGKDDDKDSTPASLAGTEWTGTRAFQNIPIIGSVAITIDLAFTSESVCNAEVTLTPSIPNFDDLPSGDYDYTFKDNLVTIYTNNSMVGDIALQYTGNTLVYTIPANIAQMLGGDDKIYLNKRN